MENNINNNISMIYDLLQKDEIKSLQLEFHNANIIENWDQFFKDSDLKEIHISIINGNEKSKILSIDCDIIKNLEKETYCILPKYDISFSVDPKTTGFIVYSYIYNKTNSKNYYLPEDQNIFERTLYLSSNRIINIKKEKSHLYLKG